MAKRNLPRKKLSKMARKEERTAYMFLLPNFIGFLIFTLVPVVLGFIISFTDYNGFKWQFVGFSNYIKMFKDSQFLTALKNNLLYSLATVPLTLVFALVLALAVDKAFLGSGFFKTVYFFPNLTSMVAIGCVAMMLFNPTAGPINSFLSSLGVSNEALPKWFMSTKSALWTVILVVVWKQAGYYMILFIGGLKAIPQHLYEAAKIDGANSWQSFWYITRPMLSPTIFMCLILCIIASFQVFDIINVTTQGGPGRATTVLVFRIYTEGFTNWKMGYASAMAYFLFMIVLVVTLIQWRGQKNWVVED